MKSRAAEHEAVRVGSAAHTTALMERELSYFKDFEREFEQTVFLPEEDKDAILERAGIIIRWEHEYFQPSPQRVQEAVYTSATHRDWQQFRVSLKGMSTRVKLARLDARWHHNTSTRMYDDPEFKMECVRIHNYIGALVRGGRLHPTTLEVIE